MLIHKHIRHFRFVAKYVAAFFPHCEFLRLLGQLAFQGVVTRIARRSSTTFPPCT